MWLIRLPPRVVKEIIDEKFAGLAIEPDRKIEGKSTMKINTLKIVKYITRKRNLSDLYFILKNSIVSVSVIVLFLYGG